MKPKTTRKFYVEWKGYDGWWRCFECYNLPGPKAWTERRTTLASCHEA